MSSFYAYETMNYAVVGPFASAEEAETWMIRVVPPEDWFNAPRSDYSRNGWRVGTLEQAQRMTGENIELETPAHAEARYRECYAEYYPKFTPPQ